MNLSLSFQKIVPEPVQNKQTEKIADLYDSLSVWERLFGYKKAKETVHKRLDFSKDADLSHFEDINEFLCSLPLELGATSRVLDAGCGHGGTILAFARKFRCSGMGISLSAQQIKTANAHVTDENVSFKVASFDAPPNEKFNLLVCVESLLHSQNLTKTYSALASTLAPNGKMLIVEDMFPKGNPEAFVNQNFSTAQFQHSWMVSSFNSPSDHISAANLAGLELSIDEGLQPRDLTNLVPTKPNQILAKSTSRATRVGKFSPSKSLRTATQAAIGGFFSRASIQSKARRIQTDGF